MLNNELVAREQIRRLMTRYTYPGDRGRVDELAACFAPDGVLEFPGATATGRDAIKAALTSGPPIPTISFMRHHVTNPMIDVAEDGLSASARSYFQVIADNGPDHAGTYSDRLILLSEGWRFAHRLVRVDWQASNSLFRPRASRPR